MNEACCSGVRSSFSGYLDGVVSGARMQEIARHLSECSQCAAEFQEAKALQATVASLGPVRAPSDLGMRLRIAISHEHARSRSNWMDSLGLHWQNAVRPIVFQISAGFAGAVFLLGSVLLLAGIVASPETVMANDEPLGALTAPHYLYSAVAPRAIATPYDTTIVVEVSVNDRGQVYDYRIVSGPRDGAVQAQVADQLLESVFEPASVFGGPVRGQAVLTFAGISVRG